MGKPYSEGCAEEARLHAAESPRYRWIGKVPRWKARRLLARSRLPMQTSIMEGGANAISEALAARLPVPTSYIRGNVSILGEDYPGYYLVGDEKALTRRPWPECSIVGRPTIHSTRPSKPSVTNIGIWCCPSAKRRL